MFKSWRMVQEDYLLGFPVGFSLLGLSYALLDIAYVFPLSNAWSWASLLFSSWGFVFLAVTYFLRYRGRRSSKRLAAGSILGAAGVLTVGTFLLVLLLPSGFLPSYLTAEIAFRIVNAGVLGYVIFSLNRALKTERELSSVVLGFTFLAIDQYSLLLNTLDRSFLWPVIFAQLVRIVGLLVLIVFLVKRFQRVG